MSDTNNMLSVLESLMPPSADDLTRKIADDFRRRRVERALTRRDLAEKSGVALANITRFEQKALISLKNLALLAIALGYPAELRDIFDTPKYSTTDELLEIRRNSRKKKAYHRNPRGNEKD